MILENIVLLRALAKLTHNTYRAIPRWMRLWLAPAKLGQSRTSGSQIRKPVFSPEGGMAWAWKEHSIRCEKSASKEEFFKVCGGCDASVRVPSQATARTGKSFGVQGSDGRG